MNAAQSTLSTSDEKRLEMSTALESPLLWMLRRMAFLKSSPLSDTVRRSAINSMWNCTWGSMMAFTRREAKNTPSHRPKSYMSIVAAANAVTTWFRTAGAKTLHAVEKSVARAHSRKGPRTWWPWP